MWLLIILGGLLVLGLALAVVVDLRDRKRGGTRKVMMPGWAERRGRGWTRASPIAWESKDYRPKPPREEDDERCR